jgi:hypothetical protein
MNTRAFIDGEHEAKNIEAPHGDPEKVPIPEGVYSFRLFTIAETTIEVDPSQFGVAKLTLRSDPFDQGPVFFVKDRVKVLSIDNLEGHYTEDEIGSLIATMKLQNTKVCLELPGKIFMPVVDTINFVELDENNS